MTRETVIEFSSAINSKTVSSQSVKAEFSGKEFPAKIHVAPNGKKITLFYNEPLPSQANIKVTLIGDMIHDMAGVAVDADGDGQPGGILAFGTRNGDSFYPGQGTELLRFVGRVVERNLGNWIQKAS